MSTGKTRLQRIFIRAQVDGKWQSVSLADVSDDEFNRWFGGYLTSQAGLDTRVRAVEWLDDLGISPVELKEGYDEDD